MATGSTSVDFNDSPIDTVAADWCEGLGLPHNFDCFTPEGELLFDDFLGLPLSSQYPLFPTTDALCMFSEIPPETPSTPGVTEDIRHSLRIHYQDEIFRPQITTKSPPNVQPTASDNKATEAESQFTELTQSSSGILPIHSMPDPSSAPVTTLPLNWIKVPQRKYDQGKKQWNFERSEPISFSVNGRLGMNMGDALRKAFTGLDGRDDPVLQDATGAISCRLLFPGYPANSSSCQIHVLDWTRKRQPITRSKLAYEVANKLKRYLDSIVGFSLDGSVEDRWRVGQGFMHIDQMFLVRLVSVSKGSFQPEIWVADPSTPHVLAGWE